MLQTIVLIWYNTLEKGLLNDETYNKSHKSEIKTQIYCAK